jgi:hypothetical protein
LAESPHVEAHLPQLRRPEPVDIGDDEWPLAQDTRAACTRQLY